MKINRILVANRGEIACRVIQTCKKMSISTVAVYSECDADSLFVQMADEAVFIGPSPSNESYLVADNIINAAKRTGADAIHPGYGFLSENAEFAQKCAQAGLIFIGPQPESINSIGDKSSAKILLREKAPSVPLIPGYNGDDQSVARLVQEAIRIGFPVLIKASAGGGGKGMRIVREKSQLSEEIEMAKGEAKRSFGNDKLLIEKYFEHVKHVEIQIMGDRHGNVYHCFERECSVQRRHQKVIEETPSPVLTDSIRKAMSDAAVTIGKTLRYEGAGTVEFILDIRDMKFYFLEVNTRLQVEHPITEAITGLDLVELQILVASNVSLANIGLEKLKINGHAIECRFYAEDPNNNFFPCTGRVLEWSTPTPSIAGKYPRFDTGIKSNSEISVYYDPLISKITTWGRTRMEAIRNMERALHQTVCLGLITNKEFLLRIMKESAFLKGDYSTRLIETMNGVVGMPIPKFEAKTINGKEGATDVLSVIDLPPHRWYGVEHKEFLEVSAAMEGAILASLWWTKNMKQDQGKHDVWSRLSNGWRSTGIRWRPSRMEFSYNNLKQTQVVVEFISLSSSYELENEKYAFRFLIVPAKDKSGKEVFSSWIEVSVEWFKQNKERKLGHICTAIAGLKRSYSIACSTKPDEMSLYIHSTSWPKQLHSTLLDPRRSEGTDKEDPLKSYTSSMPCRILQLFAKDGEVVKVGTPLLTMESMKMETRMYSRHDGIVKYHVKDGQVVEAGVVMLEVKPPITDSNDMKAAQ